MSKISLRILTVLQRYFIAADNQLDRHTKTLE